MVCLWLPRLSICLSIHLCLCLVFMSFCISAQLPYSILAIRHNFAQSAVFLVCPSLARGLGGHVTGLVLGKSDLQMQLWFLHILSPTLLILFQLWRSTQLPISWRSFPGNRRHGMATGQRHWYPRWHHLWIWMTNPGEKKMKRATHPVTGKNIFL